MKIFDRINRIFQDLNDGRGINVPRFGVGPSWMKDYQGFRLKIGTYFGLKTMFLGAKRAV